MKLKTKSRLIVLTIVFFILGASFGSALVYHINDAADALKVEYKERIDEYKSEKDFKIRNDVSHQTQQEIERMRSETEKYLQMRIGQDYQNALNKKSDEIRQTTDKKIEEIKQYIDVLMETE